MKTEAGKRPGDVKHSLTSRRMTAVAILTLVVLAASLLALGCGSSSGGSSSSASPGASSGGGSGPFTNLPAESFKVLNVSNLGDPAVQGDETEVPGTYNSIDKVSKSWKIAVLFPNVFDSYWLATNYGNVMEAKRDHASMQLFDAGGYTNLATQVTQLDTAIAQGYDAIIIGAISATGLNAGIKKAHDQGIPVIDVINGINSPDVSGHAIVSFYDLAKMTAEYIIKTSNGKPINVGFFPGPAGAAWSDGATNGFLDTIKGTNVKVVVTRRTDTAQTALLPAEQDALTTYPEINAIVGVDSAAQTGVTVVRQAGKEGQVKVYAFDQIIPVWEGIVAGTIVASPTDYTAIQGKMAVDMAVRLLEGEKLPYISSGPQAVMVTKDNAQTLNYDDMLGAKGWKIQFTVNP